LNESAPSHERAVGEAPAAEVRGERSAAIVSAVGSLQSRARSVLAAGLMMALGLSALTWYYAHAFARPARARASAQASAASRAQGEMALPLLGPILPPAAPPTPVEPPLPPAAAGTPVALPPEAASPLNPALAAAGAPKSAGELAYERRLSGVVFARESVAQASADPSAGGPGTAASSGQPQTTGAVSRSPGPLAGLLEPTLAPATQAQRLPDARYLLPKGAFLDCTLETAIDSTLPGMTTCVTAADTFGADGKVVLLERGTKLVGETRGQVQQGQARLFVLWTQARTPAGVLVPLDSPGTDELGRAGVGGQVERHFWQRFGAAILVSLIDGAVQAGVQAASRAGGTVLYAPSGSQDVMTEALKNSAQIPPTITKGNGERIEVLVARDVDFRGVYDLRSATAR
jgi:type IV secretion system protein VirB10